MSEGTHILGEGEQLGEAEEFVTFVIADMMCGVPVLMVRDVLSWRSITAIPLSPPEIAGSLNLRGRIVTVMDLRRRLGLPAARGCKSMSVVTEHCGDLYSLMVDTVGEVLTLKSSDFERNPPTLDPIFKEFSTGIYRLKEKLLVVLDVSRLLEYRAQQVA